MKIFRHREFSTNSITGLITLIAVGVCLFIVVSSILRHHHNHMFYENLVTGVHNKIHHTVTEVTFKGYYLSPKGTSNGGNNIYNRVNLYGGGSYIIISNNGSKWDVTVNSKGTVKSFSLLSK